MRITRITDIDLLVKIRLDYLSDVSAIPETDPEDFSRTLRDYFEKHVAAGDFIAVAVLDGDEIVSAGFVIINEMPANKSIPNGRYGTLLNVLTYKQHRSKGYGTMLVNALIDESRMQGLSVMDLYATADGVALYNKLGFDSLKYLPMRLRLHI